RENQAGLSRRIVRVEKIGKFQAGEMIAKWRHRGLHSIACKIHPFQKVGDLVPTNAESDLKYLRIRDFLTQGCVETGATLLDLSKVKGRHVRDGLNVIVSRKVRVGLAFVIGVTSGNGGNSIESDCLWKGGAEVWTGCAAIADEPAGVDVKLREVGEARCTRGPGSRASRQSYKLLEVDRFGPSGLEIGIEESSVADFVQRVAGDILRHRNRDSTRRLDKGSGAGSGLLRSANYCRCHPVPHTESKGRTQSVRRPRGIAGSRYLLC